MRPKVYICRRIPEEGLRLIAARCDYEAWPGDGAVSREALETAASWAEGLLTMLTDRVDAALLAQAPALRVVSNMAVGFDNIDVDAATGRGIAVTNTPGVLTETTADLAFALLLAAARRLTEAERFLRAGRWQGWKPLELAGVDVYGATLGILGFGAIGRAVARRAAGFGMRVLYNGRNRHSEGEAETGAEYRDLPDLLRESDFVSVHCALTPETEGLIGRDELALMKPDAVLVNTARGPVIDEDALYRALSSGRLRAAGLDVYRREPLPADSPLLKLDNVVLLPHIGSATVRTRTRMAVMAARDLISVLDGEIPANPVNPEVFKTGGRGR